MTRHYDERPVYLLPEEINATSCAVDYYISTINRCRLHDDHGDESACEGWGPFEYAALRSASDKLRREDRPQ